MITHFLSCDWGTTSFRLKLVDRHSGEILAQLANHQGVKSTFKRWRASGSPERLSFYQAVIGEAVAPLSLEIGQDLKGTTIILSGMASSSIGMKELPYGELPQDLSGKGLVSEAIPATQVFPYPVKLVSGLQKPGDVMRGEEVQAIGLDCSGYPLPDQYILVLPGTHSKHIRIKDRKILDFSTFMTGELYQLLSTHSILQDSLESNLNWDINRMVAFDEGVIKGSKGQLSQELFAIRAHSLQGKWNKEESAMYLSGLLIGHECSTGYVWPVVFCCEEQFLGLYQRAVEVLGTAKKSSFVNPEIVDNLTVRGQRALLSGGVF